MSLLEFEHVSYQYPSEDFDIIDDLSFSVEPGSFHCIIGAVSYTHLTLPTICSV